MGDIGEDIKGAHQEVGLTFTLLRGSGNISGEYCIIKENRQVTKPFIREFFQEAMFDYDTDVSAGDVILLNDGRHFMVMNMTPSSLMNEVIEKKSVLYKCNVSGQIYRPTNDNEWDDQYELTHRWDSVRFNSFGLLTEALYGNDVETDEELGLLGLSNHELYIPASYGLLVGDRYQNTSGEYFSVTKIAKRKYDQIHVANVGEDNR